VPWTLLRFLASSLSLIAVLGSCVLPGCSRAINPVVIDDALTAARVKTAIVNDQSLGLRLIDVRVVRGVAQLAGEVASTAESERLVALVRAVAGVVEVRSTVRVSGSSAALSPPPDCTASRKSASGR